MDVIALARQLGKAIQEDERYIAYAEASKKNDEDEALQELIGEFNLIRQNLMMEQSKPEEEQNAEKLAELNKKMHSAYNAVMTNENMADYTMAKAGMDQMMSQVNTILTASIQGDDPMTCSAEAAHSCSGSCSTCGGCG
ncbi:MAG: YlbF family regulator [Oscillospiraceae bacterium]|nr:YlbF family regulator [Oscillospiraceae bacterium]